MQRDTVWNHLVKFRNARSAITLKMVTLQNEVDLLREILSHVEREQVPQEGHTEVRLAHVLRAYEAILKRAHFQPADDTFFYRFAQNALSHGPPSR